jgi:RNA polymerase sigma-70 factor (ECF subfamily)
MKTKPPTLVRLVTGEVPLAERDDDQLMQLAAAGAPEAFATLIRRHQAALRAYCGRRSGAVGDDIAQEVFVTVWSRRANYQPGGRFRAYLFALANHRCSNSNRGRTRAALKHAAQEPPLAEGGALDALLAGERQRRLHEMLRKLSQEQQQALQLRYAAGLEYQEIAEIVGKPAATIRTRVFLGLSKLRQLVGARGDT